MLSSLHQEIRTFTTQYLFNLILESESNKAKQARENKVPTACLILIETRTELTELSIKHLSVSVLLITTGFSNSSLFPLLRD